MHFKFLVFLVTFWLKYRQIDSTFRLSETNVDPAAAQLYQYRNNVKEPVGILTTRHGAPVNVRDTSTINKNLIENQYFIQTIKHIVNERIPEREVLTKGTGAFGYIEITNDITKYTKAKVFEKVGKKTPLVARFATSQINKGGSDAFTIAARGLSLKLYTEDGNLDFLCTQIPVYLYKDPILFSPASRALRANARTNLKDFTQSLDFLILSPASLHGFLWISSEFGLPRGFRHMNAFPVHTYEIYNSDGENFFVRFKFLTELGFQGLSLKEAQTITNLDPDFFGRDLYNAIELKKYPSWRMKMEVLKNKIDEVNFDPFEVTSQWPEGSYYTVEIGRVVLNKNVENDFAQVEQAAFHPAHLVPGIAGPHDDLFRGRVLAYSAAHIHRLGINSGLIDVNRPINFRSYDRDGLPPLKNNGGRGPNYFPNSFNGPYAVIDNARPTKIPIVNTSTVVDFSLSRNFYNRILVTDAMKKRLVDNLAQNSLRVATETINKFAKLLENVDVDLSKRYKQTVRQMKNSMKLPTLIEEIPRKRDEF